MPAQLITPAIVFVLVLARVGGMVLTAPLFSSHFVPKQLRIMLAVVLALLIAPTQWSMQTPMPSDLAVLGLGIAGELLIGSILGLGVAILMAGIEVAGGVISQMSGLSLAEVYSPTGDGSVPVVANLLSMVALVIFVTIGGHRLLVSALLETYTTIPAGQAGMPASMATLLPNLLAESFSLAIRGAALAMVALMLGSVVLGLLSRTLPQLNILSIGMGLNAIVMLAVLGLSIGSIAWLFQEQLEPALTTIVAALRTTTS